ncbi:hypothetical protein TNCV_4275291 [Trichonephila clavipes]|nr:hypothetical protein TNCV_4275291 [Trichonephila clavipes]
MCGMLWGGKLLVETILRQTSTPSSVHSQSNGINCLNNCWIMLCKILRNQYPEQPPLTVITALKQIVIESKRDPMVCTGTNGYAASKRYHSSSTIVTGVW